MRRIVLIGYPLEHSMSPLIHNAALTAMGLEEDYRYEALPLRSEELPSVIQQIRCGEILGANVTLPYKVEILRHLDTLSSEAALIGSVNTLSCYGGTVSGTSTDGNGLTQSLLESHVDPQNWDVMILGAGGAARAVAYSLVQLHVNRLVIAVRSPDRASALTEMLRSHVDVQTEVVRLGDAYSYLRDCDMLVNCTPIGMKGHLVNKSPLTLSEEHSHLLVMDLVYNPLNTVLLENARSVGCRTIDGAGMLVHQGAASLKIWLGIEPPIDVMRRALLDALSSEVGDSTR